MLDSLERASGLPIAFDPVTNHIQTPANVSLGAVSERTQSELAPFLADDTPATNEVVYTVYRNIARANDQSAIERAKLRYDITVIPPGSFRGPRREFFRTAGHYHAKKPGTAVAYPEVYEVIAGRAYWVIQKPADDDATIEAVYAIEAGPGEKAIMLPGFGHVSVNAFSEPLVMANWISNAFEYDYEPFRRLRGAAYWICDGDGTIAFEPNVNYRAVPNLAKLRPQENPELGLVRHQPLYTLAARLDALAFLNTPEGFSASLTLDRCYRAVL